MIDLYAAPTSNSMRARMALEECGLAYTFHPISIEKGEHKTPQFLALNPNGQVPVIVDAGVGTASDVTIGMELGADGVLLNTGVAHAKDPVKMAQAMKLAIEAGRLAYLAGRMPKRLYASASSPLTGVVR